jgi:hypothetical protein
MLCNICLIDKPEDKFLKYFHSTQNKWRIRKQCTECYYNRKNEKKRRMVNEPIITQPYVPELQPDHIIDYSTNPDYHLCKQCEKYLPIATSFYVKPDGKVNSHSCKSCIVEKEREERLQQRQENGGSEFVFAEPNRYPDEFQKECTFKLMKIMGYLYDEETGIWTKPGWKEIRDGQPYFPKITTKRRRGKRLTQQDKQKIADLYNNGKSVGDIAIEMKISDTTIYRYVSFKTH